MNPVVQFGIMVVLLVLTCVSLLFAFLDGNVSATVGWWVALMWNAGEVIDRGIKLKG